MTPVREQRGHCTRIKAMRHVTLCLATLCHSMAMRVLLANEKKGSSTAIRQKRFG
jgi:hypothetical protein